MVVGEEQRTAQVVEETLHLMCDSFNLFKETVSGRCIAYHTLW